MAIAEKTPDNHKSGSGFPWISAILMGFFLVGGTAALLIPWPPGPANLDWGVWVLAYFGYLYIIGAAIYYALKGR